MFLLDVTEEAEHFKLKQQKSGVTYAQSIVAYWFPTELLQTCSFLVVSLAIPAVGAVVIKEMRVVSSKLFFFPQLEYSLCSPTWSAGVQLNISLETCGC